MKLNKSFISLTLCAIIAIVSVYGYESYRNQPIVDGQGVATEENLINNLIPLGTVKKTKTKVKKYKKVKTLSEPAEKSKTTSKTTTKKNVKKTDKKKKVIKVTTKVKTTVKSKYVKDSAKSTVITTVKTQVTTATTTKTSWTGDIDKAVPKASSQLRKEFKSRGYKLKYNTKVSYAGMFDPANYQIVLKREDNVAYHEFGHFVSYVKGRAAYTSKFKSIYNAEKGKYKESNKSYVTKTASEYFAESYKNYILEPSKLKAQRPKTYAFIRDLLN